MKGEEKPDYKVMCRNFYNSSSSRDASSRSMAVAAPLVVGIVLGVELLVGLLAGALVTGVLMAIFMSNAGEHGITLRSTSRQDITVEKEARLTKQPLLVIQ